MSGDASRARSVGPFVKIVASATWLAAIDGFRCSDSSTSTCVCSASCFPSFAELSLGVLADRRGDLHVLPLHLKPHHCLLGGGRARALSVTQTRVAARSRRPRRRTVRAERHHVDARAPARLSASSRRIGRAGRVHVVDEQHAPGDSRAAPKRRARSGAARRAASRSGAAARPAFRTSSGAHVDAPARASSRASAGRMVAAREEPRPVGRDIGDDVYRRPLEPFDHELGCQGRRAAEPVLLPGAHQGSRRARCSVPRHARCEREPAARALAAALDRPERRGAAAAQTAGPGLRRECRQAAQSTLAEDAHETQRAERRGRRATHSTVGDNASRVCHDFVPNV